MSGPMFQRNHWLRVMASALLCMTMISCSALSNTGESKSVPQPTQQETEKKVLEPPKEPSVPAFTAPLTGLPVEQPVLERPLAVMINNAPAARPQAGLSEADMVYEVLAEGGITRLVAFFQSHGGDVKIGPVRSIRPYLIELGETYGALPIHAGGSTDAYAILQQQRKEHLDEISNGGAYFWRSKDRRPPHNLYTDVSRLRKGSESKGYTKQTEVPVYPYLKTGETPVMVDESAASVHIRFLLKSYRVSYTYDRADQRYKRFVNEKSHLDQNNNQQLSAANVIVMSTRHRTLDDVGRLSVELDGSGEAMVFQQGQLIRAEWQHTSGDAIRFMKNGVEIPLTPGTSYIHVVPADTSLTEHVTFEAN
ncbi:putative lipoprotein YerB precursor [compost metagenome]